VATVAARTRRSHFVQSKRFQSNAEVGAASLEDPDDDPARRWRTSDGIREVPLQAFAYLYAQFFFSP